MVSARMKPFSKSVWMAPAAFGALVPRSHRPGPRLLGADGEEGDQVEHAVALADQRVEAGLLRGPSCFQELGALLGLEGRQLRLDLGRDDDAAGALRLGPLLHLAGEGVAADGGLVDVADVEHRLGGQQLQLARRPRSSSGVSLARRAGLPALHQLQRLVDQGDLRAWPPCRRLWPSWPADRGGAPGCRGRRASARSRPSRRRRSGSTRPSTWVTSSSSKQRST